MDRSIKSILVHLREHGVKTVMSCAGHRKNNWLAFINFLPNKEFEKYVSKSPWDFMALNVYGITVNVWSRYRTSPANFTKETRKQFLKWLACYKGEA